MLFAPSCSTLAVFVALITFGRVNAASYGCYSLVGDASIQLTFQYMSSGKCIDACPNSPFVAVQGESCYCLSLLPSGLLSDSQCLLACPGWPQDTCGSTTAYTVYTGTGKYVPSSSNSNSDSNSASGLALTKLQALLRSLSSPSLQSTPASLSGTESPATPTSSQSTATVVTTVSSTPSLSLTASSVSKNALSGTNAGAIAGGVVGGIAGLGIIGAAIFFFLRRRRSQHNNYDLEEEAYFDKPGGAGLGLGLGAIAPSPSFTRNSSRGKAKKSAMDMPLTNPFVHPADTATAGGAPDLIDPRMNPAMMGRQRISTGLLADEADYSRKILQVVNPER